jgi:hypothetical protein
VQKTHGDFVGCTNPGFFEFVGDGKNGAGGKTEKHRHQGQSNDFCENDLGVHGRQEVCVLATRRYGHGISPFG